MVDHRLITPIDAFVSKHFAKVIDSSPSGMGPSPRKISSSPANTWRALVRAIDSESYCRMLSEIVSPIVIVNRRSDISAIIGTKCNAQFITTEDDCLIDCASGVIHPNQDYHLHRSVQLSVTTINIPAILISRGSTTSTNCAPLRERHLPWMLARRHRRSGSVLGCAVILLNVKSPRDGCASISRPAIPTLAFSAATRRCPAAIKPVARQRSHLFSTATPILISMITSPTEKVSPGILIGLPMMLQRQWKESAIAPSHLNIDKVGGADLQRGVIPQPLHRTGVVCPDEITTQFETGDIQHDVADRRRSRSLEMRVFISRVSVSRKLTPTPGYLRSWTLHVFVEPDQTYAGNSGNYDTVRDIRCDLNQGKTLPVWVPYRFPGNIIPATRRYGPARGSPLQIHHR